MNRKKLPSSKLSEDAVKLAKEISHIYDWLKQEREKQPTAILERLDILCNWLARSAEMQADCQMILDMKRGEVAEEFIGTEESFNVVKLCIESRCYLEKRLFTLAERLNRTLTHTIEADRSLLSYLKQELENSKWQSNGSGGYVSRDSRPLNIHRKDEGGQNDNG